MIKRLRSILHNIHDRTPHNLVLSSSLAIVSTVQSKLLNWISMFITLMSRDADILIATNHDIDADFYEYLSLLRLSKIDIITIDNVDMVLSFFTNLDIPIIFIVNQRDVDVVKRFYREYYNDIIVVVVDCNIDDVDTILAASLIVYLYISIRRSSSYQFLVVKLSDILSFSRGFTCPNG